jgi:hypothetical protein
MRKRLQDAIIVVGLVLSCSCFPGCGPIRSTILEGDNVGNYMEIFNEKKPADVKVVNSIVVKYTPRLMTITTPDWEIEQIVPEKWIVDKTKKLHLRKTNDINSREYKIVSNRKNEGSPSNWYAPKDISNYEVYYMYITSTPYIHMLVDKMPVSEGRYRVFMSKH